MEVDVTGVVVEGAVVVTVVDSVVVELVVVVVVVVVEIVVVVVSFEGPRVGMMVVTSGSPPDSHSEVFLATVTGAASLVGSSSAAATHVSDVS